MTGRLDRISRSLDQLNFDPGRDHILLSVRDAVSVAGASVTRLETAVSEVAIAGLAAIRFRDAAILNAIESLPAESVVVVIGDSTCDELVSILRAIDLVPVVVDPRSLATLESLPKPASALVIVLGEALDDVWPSHKTRAAADGLPERVAVGISGSDGAASDWLDRVVTAAGLPATVGTALQSSSSTRVVRTPRGEYSVLSASTS